jgi:hypothetical protein
MGISCPQPTFCLAVDDRSFAAAFDGRSWGAPLAITPQPDDGIWVQAVACSGPRFCMVVGAGRTFSFDGNSFTERKSVSPVGFSTLISVSCPTSTFCLAVDNQHEAYVFDGSTWSAPVTADPNGNGLTAVSCPDAGFCMAVDGSGRALTYRDGDWSRPLPIGTSVPINSVSCPTRSFCQAADAKGGVLVYDGRHWSARRQVDPETALRSITCPSASFCVATAGAYAPAAGLWTRPTGGPVYEFHDGTWSDSRGFASAAKDWPQVVTCASAELCVAGGRIGYSWIRR